MPKHRRRSRKRGTKERRGHTAKAHRQHNHVMKSLKGKQKSLRAWKIVHTKAKKYGHKIHL